MAALTVRAGCRAVSTGELSVLAGVLAIASACGESDDSRRPRQVAAEVSENIATVINVHWTTDEASRGYVQYGSTKAMNHKTPVEREATTHHAATLLGLSEDAEIHYQAVSWDEDDVVASRQATIHTGDLPVGLPVLSQRGEGHELFTSVPILGVTTAVTIINPKGEIVWYYTDDRELDIYRARLSVDHESLLYNAASVSGDPAENSELVRVSLDGSVSRSIPIPLLAHDFVEHPDGTLAAIVVEYRDFEGAVWSAWDCFDPSMVQGDDMDHGWTFANALDYDPAEDAYYVGMRNFSSIAKVNRETGECEWVLGFAGSTFDFAPGSARFLHQHQFEVNGNRILVMDNDGSPGNESRVLEYELDLNARIATEVWSYVADPSVYTFVLGEPTFLDNGDRFISWSTAGQMERVTADGRSVWQLNTPAGFAFGFHTLAESLYPSDEDIP